MPNKSLVFLTILITTIVATPPYAQSRIKITTTEENTKYLWGVAKDTWACMDYFVAPETGFPYDTEQKGEGTNTTNIGLYLTSLAAATEMGFIQREEALKKANKILDSLERLQHWEGFLTNWVNVKGAAEAEEGSNALSDFNKLPAGLIVIRQEFPELKGKCTKLLDRMNWSMFYDANRKVLYGGFDVINKELMWSMELLAGDTRLATFFMIANGAAPPEAWANLKRETEEHYGMHILKPSWYGGGIFMHGICGLFLDERETEVGKSMADFAYAQMLYAQDINSPAWGWSSSTSPGGDYLGWGGLRSNVVTPHASALAIVYYPNKVIENLRAFEKFGTRSDFEISTKKYAFGFRDAVDIDTKEISFGYITALDQGMLFLSLANYLKDGLVWKLFEKDHIVKRGKELLKIYFSPHPEYIKTYSKRDTAPLGRTKGKSVIKLTNLVIDDYNSPAEVNKLGGKRFASGCTISYIKDEVETKDGNHLKIDFNLNEVNPNYFSEELNGINLSPYNALSFYIKGDKNSRYMHSFRIDLEGRNNGAVYKVKGVTDKWQKIVIPFREFGGKFSSWNGLDSYWGGFITDWDQMKKMTFLFELPQVSEGKGTIYIDNLSFEHLEDGEFQKVVLSLNNFSDSPIWEGGILDDFETKAGWSQAQEKKATLNVNLVQGRSGNGLEVDYDLGSGKNGSWAVVEKDFYLTLPDKYTFKFYLKADGNPNFLEFKLIDMNGSTFGKKFDNILTEGNWKEVTIDSKDIAYWWGGDKKLDRIKRISFAVSTKVGGKGKILIDRLGFSN